MSDAEEATGVGCGCGGDVREGEAEVGGDSPGDIGKIGRLVAASAAGDRSKIGGIGLQEDAVKADGWERREASTVGPGGVEIGIFESHYAVVSEIKIACRADTLHILRSPGKTVEYAGGHGGEGFENFQSFIESVAAMDNDRQIVTEGHAALPAKARICRSRFSGSQ